MFSGANFELSPEIYVILKKDFLYAWNFSNNKIAYNKRNDDCGDTDDYELQKRWNWYRDDSPLKNQHNREMNEIY